MAQAKKEEVVEEGKGQGRAVILPNGEKRIEYIRDAYYSKKDGTHDDEKQQTRSAIKNAINTMLKDSGSANEIPYQIVFSATKLPVDPRIAAKARAKEAAEKKAAKVKADAEAKKAVDAKK